jgi:hypothetical protein
MHGFSLVGRSIVCINHTVSVTVTPVSNQETSSLEIRIPDFRVLSEIRSAGGRTRENGQVDKSRVQETDNSPMAGVCKHGSEYAGSVTSTKCSHTTVLATCLIGW